MRTYLQAEKHPLNKTPNSIGKFGKARFSRYALVPFLCLFFLIQTYTFAQAQSAQIKSISLRNNSPNSSRLIIGLTSRDGEYKVGLSSDPLRWIVTLNPVKLGDYKVPDSLTSDLVKEIRCIQNKEMVVISVTLNQSEVTEKIFQIHDPPTVVIDFKATGEIKPTPEPTKTPAIVPPALPKKEDEKTTSKALLVPSLPVKKTPTPEPKKTATPKPTPDLEETWDKPDQPDVILSADLINFDELNKYLLEQIILEYPSYRALYKSYEKKAYDAVRQYAKRSISEGLENAPQKASLIFYIESLAALSQSRGEKFTQEAIDAARLYLRKFPNEKLAPLVLVRLAQFYQQLGWKPEASAMGEWLIEFQPNHYDPQILGFLSEFLTEMESWQTAWNISKELILKYPDFPQSDYGYYYLANAFYNMGNFAGAYTNFLKAQERDPQILDENPNLLSAWALTAFKNKNLEQSRESLLRYLKLFPDRKDNLESILLSLAESHYGLRNDDKALKYFSEVSRRYPQLSEGDDAKIFQAEIGLKHADKKRNVKDHTDTAYTKPRETLLSVYENSPHRVQSEAAGQKLAEDYIAKGEDQKAVEFYALFLRRYPDSPLLDIILDYIRVAIGDVLNKHHDEEKYEDFIQTVLNYDGLDEILKNDPSFGHLLTDSYYQLGLYGKVQKTANDYLAKSKDREPTPELEEKVLFLWAKALLAQKEIEPAIEKFDQLLSDYPNSKNKAEYLYIRGQIERDQDKPEEAIKFFDTALNTQTTSDTLRADIHTSLGDIYFENNQWLSAKRNYIQAFRVYQEKNLDLKDKLAEDLLFKLGHARYRSGDYKSAQVTLEEFIKLYPNSEHFDFVSYELAHSYWRLMGIEKTKQEDYYQKALRQFQQLQDRLPEGSPLRLKVDSDLQSLQLRLEQINK